MRVLLTGCLGFIGYHMTKKLCENGIYVLGLDNVNNYYSTELKLDRLKDLSERFVFEKDFDYEHCDITDRKELDDIFEINDIDLVINLAAQAGVRYSIENPMSYINNNILGFSNVLECCRRYNINKVIYASSSSVYGNDGRFMFKETDDVTNPESLYAATKV